MSYLICGCFCAHACRPAYICMFVCGSALWRSMSEKPNRVPISTCKWASGLASNICVQWKVNGPPVYTFLTISHDVTMNPLWTDLCQKTFRSLPLLRFSFSTFPYCTHQAASLQSEFFWWNHIFSFFFSFASFPSCPPSNSLSLSLSFSDPGAFCPWLSRSNWISTREAHCQKYQDVLIKTDFVLKAGLFETVRGTKGKKARRKNVVRLKNRYKSEKEVAKRHGERTRRKKGRS